MTLRNRENHAKAVIKEDLMTKSMKRRPKNLKVLLHLTTSFIADGREVRVKYNIHITK